MGTNDQLADLFTKPLDTHRFWNLSKSIGICHLGWSGLSWPYMGSSSKESKVAWTCIVLHWNILCLLFNCLRSLVVHAYEYFFLNQCDLLTCLQTMSFLCSNMHFWNRKCTLEVLDEWPLIDSYDMMILFVDMLISEKYAMLNCFIVNGKFVCKSKLWDFNQ